MEIENKKMNEELILSQLESIIINFLKENGGMGNGYSTYVEGCIHSLNWDTPKKNDLTGHEYKDKCNELSKKLKDVIGNNAICEIVAKHIEYGCFEMTIRIIKEKKIHLLFSI